LLQAAGKIEMQLPMGGRMEGTNRTAGRTMLKESGLKFTVAEGLYEAAQKAVGLIQ